MQVVLLEDVKALGKKGQIVNVNDGYARNFILPKKLGVEANSKNLNDLKLKKANDDRIAAEQLAAAKELGAKLDDSSVPLTIKACWCPPCCRRPSGRPCCRGRFGKLFVVVL